MTEIADLSWVDQVSPRPINARIYITELCNSRCRTCHFWKSENEAQLDTDAWIYILRQMRYVGISSIEFVGGEPTIRTDLTDLISEARNVGYKNIVVSSNGSLLSDDRIKRLHDCGVNGFNISLDGMRETYRYIRGREWFDQVIHAISSITKVGIPVLVLTNLTRIVIDELEELVDLVCSLGAYWGVNIIENLKYGFSGVNLDELSISDPDDIKKVEAILTKIRRQYPNCCILKEVDINYIKDYLNDSRQESWVPCTMGFTDVYLDPKGNVYSACMSLNPVGNALEVGLADILNSTQMKANLKAMLLRQCGGCTCGYAQRAELMHGRSHR